MKQRILFFTDDPRVPSGVGTMTKAILDNSDGSIEWHVLGGMLKHFEPNRISKYNEHTTLYTLERGYGNPNEIAHLLDAVKPDGVLFFSDPRLFMYHFNMEYEVRQKIPFMYYTIWDNYPIPMYNYGYYKSSDGIFAITKQTKHIAQSVLTKVDGIIDPNKVIEHVPHGIDIDLFKPIDTISLQFQQKVLPFGKTKNDYDYIALWNNKNMSRKRPQDAILAFEKFISKLEVENKQRCLLIMHTNAIDTQGTDLITLAEDLTSEHTNIHFTINGSIDRNEMPFLYNMVNVTICNSDAEGHGLSVTESIMCGVPVIATVTGGLQEQMGFKNTIQSDDKHSIHDVKQNTAHGRWAYPLFPSSNNIIGGIPTPYVFEDRVSIESIASNLFLSYTQRNDYRKFGLEGRHWLIENGYTQQNMVEKINKYIFKTIQQFRPRKTMEIITI
jgi:glycosyltransferase involved in cell wall biosynthesis